jgi:hypothetical protein
MPTVVESLSGLDMTKLLEKLPGMVKEEQADSKSKKK